jgi:hypothetical protein
MKYNTLCLNSNWKKMVHFVCEDNFKIKNPPIHQYNLIATFNPFDCVVYIMFIL